MQMFCMLPSLDGHSARICDAARENLSIDFVFFLDINIPVDQVQSKMHAHSS